MTIQKHAPQCDTSCQTNRGARGSSLGTLVGLLVAALVCIGVTLLLVQLIPRVLAPHDSETEAPAAVTAEPVEATSIEQVVTEEAPADNGQAGEDTRAQEFAVDPNRTEWNFEPSDQKTVYLTFDDGPSANTAAVLDILDQYGIKATFFVTALNPEYLPMIGECYRRGHTIGMHTYSHDYAQVYASLDAYWADLDAISQVVEEQIGYVPCFIRFPGGSSNTISANYTQGIMSALAEQVVAAGYQYYDWDASCGDGAVHTADELVAATEADTAYGYQNIIFLAHDGAGKETTVEALPRIIEYFAEQGYTFAPLDRQTCVTHHGIGN